MPKFVVDGTEYPMLDDDLTIDEAGWFYRIAGVGIEALGDPGMGDQTMKVKALICLSIAREKPEQPHSEIEKRIGALKMTELEEVFIDVGEQSPPLQNESVAQSETSGEVSSAASGDSQGEDGQAPTGSPLSDHSESGQETSASLRRVS